MINYLPGFLTNNQGAQPASQEYGRLDMMDNDFEIGAESSSLITKGQESAPSMKEKLTSGVMNKIEEKTGDLTKPNYTMMAIFFAVGCLFLLAAVTALPFILISPAGFNMYFSLATTCLLVSVSFYYGPLNYLKTLFEKKNLAISCLFLGSTLASLSTIFVKSGYLWSIGLVIL